MKTTVYAVRDQNKTRLSYRYRDIETAREVKGDLERQGATGLEVFIGRHRICRQLISGIHGININWRIIMPFYLTLMTVSFYLFGALFFAEAIRHLIDKSIMELSIIFIISGLLFPLTLIILAIFSVYAGYYPTEVLSFGLIAPIPY